MTLNVNLVKKYLEKVKIIFLQEYRKFLIIIMIIFFGKDLVKKYYLTKKRTNNNIIWFFDSYIISYNEEIRYNFIKEALLKNPSVKLFEKLLFDRRNYFKSKKLLEYNINEYINDAINKKNPHLIKSIASVAKALDSGKALQQLERSLDAQNVMTQQSKILKTVQYMLRCEKLMPLNPEKHKTDLFQYPSEHKVKNRLVVCDQNLTPAACQKLVQGADQCVLFNINDLYGKLDLSEIETNCAIRVEHPRTRIRRFSKQYHDIHKLTSECGEKLAKIIIKNDILNGLLENTQNWVPYLTLELADSLFFRYLKTAAFQKLVTSNEFDHIILVFGDSQEFYRMITVAPEMISDPRVYTCCYSYNDNTLLTYEIRLSDIYNLVIASESTIHPIISQLQNEKFDKDELRRKMVKLSQSFGERIKSHASGHLDRITLNKRTKKLFIAANDSSAYYSTFLETIVELSKNMNVTVGWTGKSVKTFKEDLQLTSRKLKLKNFKCPRIRNLNPSWLYDGKNARLWSKHALKLISDDVSNLLEELNEENILYFCTSEILFFILDQNLLKLSMSSKIAETYISSDGYDCVALYPSRPTRLAAIANIARNVNVPSVTIESHALNGAYCRYGSIMTDFVAVPGEYFKKEYTKYYNIANDRCFVIGSPRLSRDKNFALSKARKVAREKVGMQGKIVLFMSQPLDQGHLDAIWIMILQASKEIKSDTFKLAIKCHPEENFDRQNRYIEMAEKFGVNLIRIASDQNPKEAIVASDIVLSCYSATLLEAAILGVPVASVNLPGKKYPVPYDKVIGCPNLSSVDDLIAIFEAIVNNDANIRKPVDLFLAQNAQYHDGMEHDRLSNFLLDIMTKQEDVIISHKNSVKDPFVKNKYEDFVG